MLMTGDKRASARFLPLLSLHHFSFSFLLRGALAAVLLTGGDYP